MEKGFSVLPFLYLAAAGFIVIGLPGSSKASPDDIRKLIASSTTNLKVDNNTQPAIIWTEIGFPVNILCSAIPSKPCKEKTVKYCKWERLSRAESQNVTLELNVTESNRHEFLNYVLEFYNGECDIYIKELSMDDVAYWSCKVDKCDEDFFTEKIEVKLLNKPNPPKIIEDSLKNIVHEVNQNLTCCGTAACGKPEPNLFFIVDFKPIIEESINKTTTDCPQHLCITWINAKFTSSDNGKIIKCLATFSNNIPDISSMDENKSNFSTDSKRLDVKFPPAITSTSDSHVVIHLGEDAKIANVSILFSANPMGTGNSSQIDWKIKWYKVSENNTTLILLLPTLLQHETKYSAELENVSDDTWETQFSIERLETDDLEYEYLLEIENNLGVANISIKFQTSRTQPNITITPQVILGLILLGLILLTLICLCLWWIVNENAWLCYRQRSNSYTVATPRYSGSVSNTIAVVDSNPEEPTSVTPLTTTTTSGAET